MRPGIAWIIVIVCFVVGYGGVAAVMRYFNRRIIKKSTTGCQERGRSGKEPDFAVNQADGDIKRPVVGDLEAHYRSILGVSSRASEFEIQANYRLLMSRYDMNKLTQLGEDFSRLADQKQKDISMAYEYLKRKYSFR